MPTTLKTPKINYGVNPTTIEDVDDDMLTQILLRLPSSKTVVACSPVNKRWCSLISDPNFPVQFVNHKKKTTALIDDEPPSTFIINMVKTNGTYLYEVIDGIIKLTTQLLLEFVPSNIITGLATFKDLILCPNNKIRNRDGLVYYITNSLTKQWVALPPRPFHNKKPVTNIALICQPPYNHTQHYNFRVVEFRGYRLNDLVAYCSEIGEWKEINLRVPITGFGLGEFEMIVCNGIIYFNYGLCLVGFDPFDVNDTCDTTLEARGMPPLPDLGYLLESSGQLLLVQATERWGKFGVWYKIDGTTIELEMVVWKLDLNKTPLVWETTFKGLCKGTVSSIEFPDYTRREDNMCAKAIRGHPYNDKLIYMYLESEKQFVLCDTTRTGYITSSESLVGLDSFDVNDYCLLKIKRLEQQWWPTSVPALPSCCSDQKLPPPEIIV